MNVVYFDYWTNGVGNFTAIDKRFKAKGHNTMLFHIGSFRNPNTPPEEIIEGVLCRDIFYYKTKYIYQALKILNPDVIISLNTTYITDRALVMACRALKIKSVFLMHGDRATTNDEIIAESKAINFSLIFKIKKSIKYIKYVIPNYFLSSWYVNELNIIKMIPLIVLFKTFITPNISFIFPPFSQEALHDKCLVYSNKYLGYYQKLGYTESQIIVTGNPKNDYLFDLINYNFPTDNIRDINIKKLIVSGNKYALYLDEALQVVNHSGYTYEYFFKELNNIAIRLKDEEIELIVKLHPSTDIDKFPKEKKHFSFYQSYLEYLIHYSTFCFGHISSAVNVAIILNKPVISTKWGRNKNIPDYYIKNNVAKSWNNINDDIDLTTNEVARTEYLKENVSILQPISTDMILNEILT